MFFKQLLLKIIMFVFISVVPIMKKYIVSKYQSGLSDGKWQYRGSWNS